MSANERGRPKIEVVYTRTVDLEFPLGSGQVCAVLGIGKTSLFRWEQLGLIPKPERTIGRVYPYRVYTENDLLAIMRTMQGIKYPRGEIYLHPWVRELDLSTPGSVINAETPSGYRIRLTVPTE